MSLAVVDEATVASEIVGVVHGVVLGVVAQVAFAHLAHATLSDDAGVGQAELHSHGLDQADGRPDGGEVLALRVDGPTVVLGVAVRVPVGGVAGGLLDLVRNVRCVGLQRDGERVHVDVVAAYANIEDVGVLGVASDRLHRDVRARSTAGFGRRDEHARAELLLCPACQDVTERSMAPVGLGAALELRVRFEVDAAYPPSDGKWTAVFGGLEDAAVLFAEAAYFFGAPGGDVGADLDGLDAALDLGRQVLGAFPVRPQQLLGQVNLLGRGSGVSRHLRAVVNEGAFVLCADYDVVQLVLASFENASPVATHLLVVRGGVEQEVFG